MVKTKWYLDEDERKVVRIIGDGSRIMFERKGMRSSNARGVTISANAFANMQDVSIKPDLSVELETNVFLRNYGHRIHLNKYCTMRDTKRCEGGFFYFTPSEWQLFWTTIRSKVLEKIDEEY